MIWWNIPATSRSLWQMTTKLIIIYLYPGAATPCVPCLWEIKLDVNIFPLKTYKSLVKLHSYCYVSCPCLILSKQNENASIINHGQSQHWQEGCMPRKQKPSDTKISDRCMIDIDPMVFAIRVELLLVDFIIVISGWQTAYFNRTKY